MGWPMGEQEFNEISNQNLDNVVRVKLARGDTGHPMSIRKYLFGRRFEI